MQKEKVRYDLRTVVTYISVYIIFYMNAFTSSWQPNELIFYGHFLLLLSSIYVSNGDWSCLFAFFVDSAPLHLHQPSPSFLPFTFALLWASHVPVLRRQMITSHRQPPQQAIAALAVAVLTKAKDVMGHRDIATRNILRARSGIRGNRNREGVGKVCRKQALMLHPAFGSNRMLQSLSNWHLSVLYAVHVLMYSLEGWLTCRWATFWSNL